MRIKRKLDSWRSRDRNADAKAAPTTDKWSRIWAEANRRFGIERRRYRDASHMSALFNEIWERVRDELCGAAWTSERSREHADAWTPCGEAAR